MLRFGVRLAALERRKAELERSVRVCMLRETKR